MSLPAALALSAAQLAGCTGAERASSVGPWSEGVYLPAEPADAGDPVRGRELLLEGDAMTCGIPYRLWELGGDAIAAALGGDAAGPRIEGRSGDNADLPYGLTAFTTPDGVEVVNANCLSCHGGMADGELVIGLGNADADFTGDAASSAAIPASLLDLIGLSEAETAEFAKLTERAAAIADAAVMRTVGNNPAEMMAVALMVHHDRDTLAWSDAPLTDFVIVDETGAAIPDAVVTSDPPPWWRVKKKHALFYNGMARGDGRGTMALATSLCVDSVERAEVVDAEFTDIHAFVLSIVAPVYKRRIDAELAEQGHGVFDVHCAGCHGTYGEDPEDDASDTYPNLLIPLDVIGTDPVVAEAGVVHSPDLVDWYNGSFYGRITRMAPNDPFPGYMPPPLDGIWATAPYLHNGSVPTIAALLDTSARPDAWRRIDRDSTNFDEDALGWPYEAVASQASVPADQAIEVYDTSFWSQSNAGHPFGDPLDPEARAAVIEYLKTL